MVNYPELNVLAIIVATALNIAIGFLWYSDKLPTGEYWLKEMGYNTEELQMNAMLFALNTLGTLFINWGIAMVIAYSAADGFIDGLQIGALVWLAFVATTQFTGVVFEDRKPSVYGVFIGYQLVAFLVSGVLLALWD
jgi:hypothetical protein